MPKVYSNGYVEDDFSERFKHSLITMGFHGYFCGYCGKAYFTLRGLNGCCADRRARGDKEIIALQLFGRSPFMPTGRSTTVTGIGYPGQFDNCSSRYNNSMMPMNGHRH